MKDEKTEQEEFLQTVEKMIAVAVLLSFLFTAMLLGVFQ